MIIGVPMQMIKIILSLNIPVIGGGSNYLIVLASSILPMKLCLKKLRAFFVSSAATPKEVPEVYLLFILC